MRTSAIISQQFPGPAKPRGFGLRRANSYRLIYPNRGKKANAWKHYCPSLPPHPAPERGSLELPAEFQAACSRTDLGRKARSGRADRAEELADLELEAVAFAGQ